MAMSKESKMSMSKESNMSKEMGMSNQGGGHLYIQTNEIRNSVIHYRRDTNGRIAEVERTATGGRGSGTCGRAG